MELVLKAVLRRSDPAFKYSMGCELHRFELDEISYLCVLWLFRGLS